MPQTLFQLAGVTFAYPDGASVLRNVNFELQSGERVALSGPNGIGKTTLLRLMVGLLKPQSGTILAFDKLRAVESDFVDVRARAGFLFQDPDDQLFCPTVLDDVAFGPMNMGQSLKHAHKLALKTLATLEIDHLAQRTAHKLSGGQKRLVALACVLAMEPEVLLLDEPTNALDQKARETFMCALEKLPQAMVLVAHDEEFIERFATRRFSLV